MADDDREWDFRKHEEGMFHSEIHFLKRQQWLVTGYAFALYGALVGVPKLRSPTPKEGCLLIVLALLVGLGGSSLFWKLERALWKARGRTRRARIRLLRLRGRNPRGATELHRRCDPVPILHVAALSVGLGLSTWALGAHPAFAVPMGATVVCLSAYQAGRVYGSSPPIFP